MHEICMRNAWDMHEILMRCMRFNKDMPEICFRIAREMFETWLRYAWDINLTYSKQSKNSLACFFCSRYVDKRYILIVFGVKSPIESQKLKGRSEICCRCVELSELKEFFFFFQMKTIKKFIGQFQKAAEL